MGNYTSCANLALHPTHPKSVRVILPGGQIRHFHHPVKAAHLMLDHPAYFVSNTDADSFNIGRRFSPLAADQDLQFGNLYVMLPMTRLNSTVTVADAAVFLMAANTDTNTNTNTAMDNAAVKVSPEPVEDFRQGSDSENGWSRLRLEYKYRVSRKPLLDTITEEPSFFIFLT